MAKKARTARKAARPTRKAKPAARKVQPIPKGYHSVTPYLMLSDAAGAIDFYTRAFGAREVMRLPAGSKIAHAEIRLGDSVIMLSDEMPGADTKTPQALGGTTGYCFVYVPNVDATMDRAAKAGATVTMPATDMFWGDRFGRLLDPFGHRWGFATHKEDVPPKEMGRRAAEAMAKMGQPG